MSRMPPAARPAPMNETAARALSGVRDSRSPIVKTPARLQSSASVRPTFPGPMILSVCKRIECKSVSAKV